MPDILLELKNIKKSFTPGEDVLDDICLTVARGEFVFLVHPDAVRLLRCVLLLVWNRQTVEVYGSMVRM